MRWRRLFLFLALLGALSCSNPLGPQYPDPDDEGGGKQDPSKGGFVLADPVTFWV
jgi:hypothetical protein